MGTPKKSESDRREFMEAALAALFAGVAVHIVGCGGNLSGPGGTVPPAGSNIGFVGDNTDPSGAHVAFVTKAQMNAMAGVTLHIQGYADHDHLVTLADADMINIVKGIQVSADSTTNSSTASGFHSHRVTFN